MAGDPASPNSLMAFGYAGGNPLLFTDPDGLKPRIFIQDFAALSHEQRVELALALNPASLLPGAMQGDTYASWNDETLNSFICGSLSEEGCSSSASGLDYQMERAGRGLGSAWRSTGGALFDKAVTAAQEADESLKDTATNTIRHDLMGPTVTAIANDRMRPADAAPEVLGNANRMARGLGEYAIDSARDEAIGLLVGAAVSHVGGKLVHFLEVRRAERMAVRAERAAAREAVKDVVAGVKQEVKTAERAAVAAGQGTRAARVSTGPEMALGLARHGDTGSPQLLNRFAKHVNAKTYGELQGTWWPGSMERLESTLTEHMDGARRIHFNLDQVDMKRFREFTRNPTFTDHNITNWELHRILTTPELRTKTTFYGPGGTVVPAPAFP